MGQDPIMKKYTEGRIYKLNDTLFFKKIIINTFFEGKQVSQYTNDVT